MVVATERIHCHVPVHGGFWKYWSFLSALFALGILYIIPPFSSLYLAVIACSFGCCLWSTVIGFSGDPGATLCAMLGSTVVTCSAAVLAFLDELHTFSMSTWTRIAAYFSVLTQNGEVCSVDASV